MKKNKMMRMASILLVLTLLSTSVISGTFAKYTTQDSAEDSARVAKWGVELQVVGNLYGETYKDTIVADTSAVGEFTVQSKNAAEDVVAPGTENKDGFAFSLQGTPEVSGEVVVELAYENIYLNAGTYGLMVEVSDGVITASNFDEFFGTGLYTKNGNAYTLANAYNDGVTYYTLEDEVFLGANYYPVEYSMTGNGTTVTAYNTEYTAGLSVDTLAEIGKLIANVVGTESAAPETTAGRTTATYKTSFIPNQDLQTVVKLGNQEINWKWDFCQQNGCENGNAACTHCKADTILGNLMAKDVNGEVVKLQDDNSYKAPVAASDAALNDYNLETEFSINITVTQVD